MTQRSFFWMSMLMIALLVVEQEQKSFLMVIKKHVSHTITAIACDSHLKTGVMIQRSEISGLLSCLKLMSIFPVSIYSGGFDSVFCPPQLEILRKRSTVKTNLEDVFHINPPETPIKNFSSKTRLCCLKNILEPTTISKLGTETIVLVTTLLEIWKRQSPVTP